MIIEVTHQHIGQSQGIQIFSQFFCLLKLRWSYSLHPVWEELEEFKVNAGEEDSAAEAVAKKVAEGALQFRNRSVQDVLPAALTCNLPVHPTKAGSAFWVFLVV